MNHSGQIQNLISRHKIRDKFVLKINDWIRTLEARLNELEELPAQSLEDFSRLLSDVKCPLNNDQIAKSLTDASILFRPPRIHSVGSFPLNCNAKQNNIFQIDLVLEIPKSCWQKKDHLDFVYHWKRAFYLAYIAKCIRQFKDLSNNVQYRYWKGDQLKPYLQVKPTGKLALYYRFNISAVPSLDKTFIFKNFLPNKSNIRNLSSKNLESTSYYNSGILADLAAIQFAQNISQLISHLTNVQDALILVKIWLDRLKLRREFSHIITMFTCYLLKNRQLNPNFSPLQIFETILDKIVNSNWNTILIKINLVEEGIFNDEFNQWRQHFPVNLIEISSGLNLCYNLRIGSYERLKLDAGQTIKFLNTQNFNLMKIFTTNIDFNCYFDFQINISTSYLHQNHLKKNNSLYIESGYNLINGIIPELYELFNLAIGDRLCLCQLKEFDFENQSWEITKSNDEQTCKIITFGILTKEYKFLDVITKGPIADQPEAKQFRDFWLEKSEIRRFQNGDIREAVYWNCPTVLLRRRIIIEALKFVLTRKMNLKQNAISWTFDFLDSLLEIKNIQFNDPKFHYGTGEECLAMINQSMNVLKKYIHDLKLSFNVTEVLNIDQTFRLTDVFPPLSVNSNAKNVKNHCNVFNVDVIDDKIKFIRPIKLVIKIEPNRKLSNDMEELKNQKCLFYCEMARMLFQAHNLPTLPHVSYLDVYHEGFVFRLILCFQKELSILRQISSNTKMVKMVENDLADQLEFETTVLPAISSSLGSLTKENVSFSLTCRLFKRWLSRHMMKHFFEDITLDLLVAYSYIHFNHCYPSKNSHLSSFIRLLNFLVEFDFIAEPIILNFNDSLSTERITNIRESFQNQRSNFPIMFIATSYDRKLSYHTRSSPDARIIFHMKKLAKFTLDALETSLSFQISKPNDVIKNLFKPNMDIFDLVIKLNSKIILNKHQSMDFPENIIIKHRLYSEQENKNNPHQHAMPITDFNPPYLYLETLKKAFKNFALFFYDEFGGREIGVLLRPDVLEPKPFKYSSVEACKLHSTSHSLNTDNVYLNIEAIVEDFKILGENLVESVILKTEKFQ